jgi:hypothetical protein
MSKRNVEEIKKLTMEHFGINDPKEVEFITEEYLNLDFQDEIEDESRLEWDESAQKLLTTMYVHNTSFDGNYYSYHRGDGSLSQACSHANNYRVPFSRWTHSNTGRRCSHGGGAHSQIAVLRTR